MDNALIARAIVSGHLLRFEYGGQTRLVEPHTYGLDKFGDRLLVAFQIGGGSNSGEPQGWKTFRESEMGNIAITATTFARPRPEYRRNDGVFACILAQL